MRIYSVVAKTESKKYEYYELKDFGYFEKSTIKDFIGFFTDELIERRKTKEDILVIKENLTGSKSVTVYHCYFAVSKIHIIIYTDEEYPENVIKRIILSLRTNNNEQNIDNELKRIITDYQDPRKADQVYKIQCELDETIEVVHKTIESVLNRGEKLEDLVKRSELLSNSSKMFYTSAKKHNSCCVVM